MIGYGSNKQLLDLQTECIYISKKNGNDDKSSIIISLMIYYTPNEKILKENEPMNNSYFFYCQCREIGKDLKNRKKRKWTFERYKDLNLNSFPPPRQLTLARLW